MKMNVMVFITTTPKGEVAEVQAHSQGINYKPLTMTKVNGIYRAIFAIEGEKDTTPALEVSVAEHIRTVDKVGG